MAEIREYVLSEDDYKNPKIFEGEDAVAVLLIRLFLLNPGEIETHPNAGIGLYKNYRNMWMDDIPSLQSNAEKQISEYLPMLTDVNVNITQSNTDKNILKIEIQVKDTIYSLMSNGNNLRISLDALNNKGGL